MIKQLAAALLEFTERQTTESPFLTAIEGVGILRSDYPKPPLHMLMRPAICIVAQGAKRATFGRSHFEYRAGQALVVGVETPSVGRVFEASPGKPCLVLAFELDSAIMRSVAERLDPRPKFDGKPGQCVFVTDVEGPLVDCALRLVRLLDTPKAIPVLHPIIMQEICYWLLEGPHGGEIARLTLSNSPSHGVITALHRLRMDFRAALRVEELAQVAHLSTSAFHRQFKAITGLSPLQFQKQLRLLEARRLMLTTAANVETAAYEVGYESPSQFSREYARMFGDSPKRDLRQASEMMQ